MSAVIKYLWGEETFIFNRFLFRIFLTDHFQVINPCGRTGTELGRWTPTDLRKKSKNSEQVDLVCLIIRERARPHDTYFQESREDVSSLPHILRYGSYLFFFNRQMIVQIRLFFESHRRCSTHTCLFCEEWDVEWSYIPWLTWKKQKQFWELLRSSKIFRKYMKIIIYNQYKATENQRLEVFFCNFLGK